MLKFLFKLKFLGFIEAPVGVLIIFLLNEAVFNKPWLQLRNILFVTFFMTSLLKWGISGANRWSIVRPVFSSHLPGHKSFQPSIILNCDIKAIQSCSAYLLHSSETGAISKSKFNEEMPCVPWLWDTSVKSSESKMPISFNFYSTILQLSLIK